MAPLKLGKDQIIRVKQLRSRALDKVRAVNLASRAVRVSGRRSSFESKEASMDKRLHSLITKEEFWRKNVSIFDDKYTRTYKTFAASVHSFNLNADEVARAHVLQKRAVSRQRRANTSSAAATGHLKPRKRGGGRQRHPPTRLTKPHTRHLDRPRKGRLQLPSTQKHNSKHINT